jgi:hypothetical protein
VINVGYSTHTAMGDINGDGYMDLYVSNDGEKNQLFLGDASGGLTEDTGSAAVLDTDRSSSRHTAMGDINGDGYMDLYVSNYGGQNFLFYGHRCGDHEGFKLIAGSVTSVCAACPSFGIGATSVGVQSCLFCPGGRVGPPLLVPIVPAQEYLCLACEGGKYRGHTEQVEECANCPFGRYTVIGASECSKCDPGQVTITTVNGEGASGCVACPAGTSPNEPYRTECHQCLGARYSPFGFKCVTCELGKAPGAVKSNCNPFAIGDSFTDRVVVLELLNASVRITNERNSTEAISTSLRVTLNAQGDATIPDDQTSRAVFAVTASRVMANVLETDTTLTISNIEKARRRLGNVNVSGATQDPVAIKFDVHLATANAAELLGRLHEQLANPSSLLQTQLGINTSHAPTYALVCPPGHSMDHESVCVKCPIDKYSADGSACERCTDVSMVPTAIGDRCICPSNKYSRMFGTIACFESGYKSDWKEEDAYAGLRDAIKSGHECAPWPTAPDGSPLCVNRNESGTLLVMPGWGLATHVQQTFQALETGTHAEVALFACPAGDANCRSTNGASICGEGSSGPLCSICDEGFIGGTSHACSPCGLDSARRRAQTQDRSAISDVVKIVVVAVLALVAATIIFVVVREYRAKVSPLVGFVVKHRKALMAAKDKVAALGLDEDEDDNNNGGGEEEGEDIDMGGEDELLDLIKIFISHFQILTLMPVTFDFKLPDLFDQFLDWFSALNFDLLDDIINVDCLISQPTFVQKFAFTMCLPIVVLMLLLLLKQLSSNRVFLVLFLLYPQLSTSVFQMFMCRDLDHGESIHRFDSGLDCNSSSYHFVRIIAIVCMILYPFGIPIGFGFLQHVNRAVLRRDYSREMDLKTFKYLLITSLYKNKGFPQSDESFGDFQLRLLEEKPFCDHLKKLFGQVDTDSRDVISDNELIQFTMRNVASEMPTEMEKKLMRGPISEKPTASAVNRIRGADTSKATGLASPSKRPWWKCDPQKQGEELKFLVKAYEPDYYWFELVEYARKLFILGVLLFADQGSISQMYLALVISFSVVLITTRTMPYKNETIDRYKVAMDVNLFFTFSCALLLKLNLAGEFLSAEFFDVTMVTSNLLIGVFPAVWSVYHSAKVQCFKIIRTLDKIEEANEELGGEQKLTRLQTLKKLLTSNKAEIQDLLKALKKLIGDDDNGDDNGDDEDDDNGDDEGDDNGDDEGDDNETQTAVALQLAIAELRPKIEPHLLSRGMQWDDVQPALELIDSVEKITAAIEDMEAFLEEVMSAAVPVATKRLLAKLRPTIEPRLLARGMTWDGVLPAALQLVDSLDKLTEAIDDPEAFLEKMMALSQRETPRQIRTDESVAITGRDHAATMLGRDQGATDRGFRGLT